MTETTNALTGCHRLLVDVLAELTAAGVLDTPQGLAPVQMATLLAVLGPGSVRAWIVTEGAR